jgi:phosphoribosylaminoimidazole synthetase
MNPASLGYLEAGVDRAAADRLLAGLGRWGLAGGRRGCVQAAGGYAAVLRRSEGPDLAVTADGVGTKLLLALAAGDHRGIGQDLVAMSVNDLLCVGAKPLLFMDYLASGKLDPTVARVVLQGIGRACAQVGCLWAGGETAELPDLLPANHYDVAGFCVGTVERAERWPRRRLRPGDVLVGLASSGFHANGFSLVRKLLEVPWPTGRLRPDVARDRGRLTRALLQPTRLYPLAVAGVRDQVLAAAHLSGSAWRNLSRMDARVSYAVTLPPLTQRAAVFRWLDKLGAVDFPEAAQTFNLGVGLVLAVSARKVDGVLARLHAQGERAWRLGEVTVRAQGGPSQIALRADEGEATLAGRAVTGGGPGSKGQELP